MSKHLRDTEVVAVSFSVSLLDVLINLIVAVITGSAVMLAQMFQGLSDLITAAFLYHGVRASKRGRDERHDFGHGREVYFWVMISAFFMFFGTGLLSLYFGYRQFSSPEHVANGWLALVVLGVVLVTNAYAFYLSVKRLFQDPNPAKLNWWQRILRSPMIETKTTFIVDLLGTSAAIIGLIAIAAFAITGDARFDGLGGMIIGLAMMAGSLALIADVKGLIVGRSLSPHAAKRLVTRIRRLEGVNDVLDLRSMYIGSTRLLIVIEVHLDDALSTDEIEVLSDRIKETTGKVVPYAAIVQVEAETPDEELLV
ncbi:MAG TPA: cation diffusion facilitator family transporter [Candidatus Saccharimonadales bacterium]|nr:cation diffusion facilitator family transporter [Candidatus Saccharimonadales bacterium]